MALRRECGVEAENGGGHQLVHRLAETLHGDLGESRAVDREIDGLTDPQIAKRIGREGRAILGCQAVRPLADVHLKVEDIDRVDGLHGQAAVAAQRRAY